MKKVITERDIIATISSGIRIIHLDKNDIITPLAADRIKSSGIEIIFGEEKKQNESSPVQYTFTNKTISVGCDHTGFALKKMLIGFLNDAGYKVTDVGTFDEKSCDYPDFAEKVALQILEGKTACGLLVDATGIPSAITANKFPGIRAATCYNEFTAKSSREHNNANILVIGAKAIGEETAKSILKIWLESAFLGDRHQRRLDKISEIERKIKNASK